ncbi:Phosphoenolpyruvate synthase [Aquisphaera giovannonii]|uniref:Phosphoenolpyruvate synthase n=1 Tax=Aquisphaera giovannonii TaxID=406548 RepID=A0A5B9WCW1_9BACT|nr:PEP/pyruvate-binding domain-containing protein [Aquisphaera giovannonii]QEH38357.1 Phosphoenolpyruvate synthase [Aquisphaera giovannonii]
MDLVIGLDRPGGAIPSLVGGKGTNLATLTLAGFPVPPGFVVTSEAYRRYLDAIDWLDEALGALDFGSPSRLRDQCEELRGRLREHPLPPDVAAAIVEALEGLGASEECRFAVRSSSTLEDMAQAAFAGQHDTYLGVSGRDAIADRVRDVFVSLWGDRAVLYRHHQGFDQRQARMAVVVQRQVACDRAGVGFSIDPVGGRLDRLVIDANYGLGESVVSGEGEVDHFELDKGSLEITCRSIGHKDRRVVTSGGGVGEEAVPADLADAPCLADAELAEVAGLLKRVEAHYGWPQDIEWGYLGAGLFLFQSRAVTTIQPRYTRDESAERFPNPMTPLTWDFLGAVFRRSLTHSLALMGLPPLKDDWFSLHDFYVYGNQNAVDLLAAYRPLRARSLPELIAEIPDLRRRYAWVLELPVRWARDLDRYLIRLGRLSARPLSGLGVPELWEHALAIQEVAGDYFEPNIAISITQSFLHRLLLGLVELAVGPGRAMEVFDGLMAGCETKTAVVNRELHGLALLAARDEALRRELIERGGRAAWDGGELAGHREFAGRLARFLDDHGHREIDMDYSVPTWSGQPWVVLDTIALILRQPSPADPEGTAREQRLRFAEVEVAFLAGLPEGVRFFFRELIRLARTYTTLDDVEHYQTTRINPVARDVAIEMGRRLVEAGILDVPEDVFFFRRADLESLVAEFPPRDPATYRARALAARRGYERARGSSPPWALGGDGEGRPAAGDEAAGRVLKGIPGSPGSAQAPCFLVHGPDDFARFPAGSILVARTTNPAWTSLFYSAAGLIAESGGPLSHGAVTAREMGLPAVMSVRGVMGRLHDGDVVSIDGARGTVSLEGR